MNHWAHSYLKKKYELGGRGPDKFDCWGLVCDVYEKQLGIQLPSHHAEYMNNVLSASKLILRESSKPEWKEIKGRPKDYDVVELASGRVSYHVGLAVWIDNSLHILHAQEDFGIVLVSQQTMELIHMLKIKKVHRHVKI